MTVEMGQRREVEQKLVFKRHSLHLFPDLKRMVDQGIAGKEDII